MDHIELGKTGEKLAEELLVNKGYDICERNFRAGSGEIDLIAWAPAGQPRTLVFFEVKTRSYDFFGSPEAFVGKKKQEMVSKTAGAYMNKINYDWAVRFDVISIMVKRDKSHDINHIEDAYFPLG